MKEGVLYQVAQFIEMLVIFALNLSVFSRRDNRFYPLRESLRNNGIGVVTAISQQVIGFYVVDEFASL